MSEISKIDQNFVVKKIDSETINLQINDNEMLMSVVGQFDVNLKELAKLTGETPREVNFYLPADDVALLRTIPGFENFDPLREVLHCDKPGTGLADAPRAFQIKLSMILSNKCRMYPSKIDAELCFRHDDQGRLVCVMTIHVDDLKIAGEPQVVDSILAELGRQFGELTVQRGCFTNCGTRHVQDVLTMEISLDQIEYAGALRTIEHPQMKTGRNEESCTPELHQLYMSLLGAVAYLSHTRVDLTVFIVALQRRNHNPEVQHARKLNKLLRWLQQECDHDPGERGVGSRCSGSKQRGRTCDCGERWDRQVLRRRKMA